MPVNPSTTISTHEPGDMPPDVTPTPVGNRPDPIAEARQPIASEGDPPMPEASPGFRLAFLTSYYTKQSHTFMRQEVAGLRDLGWDVKTFSIRQSPAAEMVGQDVQREHNQTTYVLDAGGLKLLLATAREFWRSPRRFFQALRLSRKVVTPGVAGHLWPLAYVAEAAYLAGLLRGAKIQHLHNHLGRSSAAVAMLTSALTDIPYSLTIHGPTEFDEARMLALGEKIHRSAFTVAISEYGRSQLCRWSKLADWPKIHVVHCGIHRDFLAASPTPLPETPRLVSVGRLAEQKGQLVLVEAAAMLRDRGIAFDLEIVGDGPMRGEIERFVESHGLGDRIHLAGWRDSQGVRQAILDARIMVLPSFAEGLPVVLMEALALGRPVVSTYVAGIPELVRPGQEGWLVPPGSAVMLADTLAQALATPTSELTAMGQSGAARVAQRHNITTEVARLARLITGSSTSPEQPG